MAALLILLNVPLPLHTRLGRAAADLAHAPLFAVLGIVVLIAYRRFARRPGTRVAFVAWLLTALFGFLSEWTQHLSGRQPSWHDFRADLLGAAAGIVWMGTAQATSRPWRLVERAAGVVLFVLAIWPGSVEFTNAVRQWAEMPQLASFERPDELARWSFQESRAECDPSQATHGRFSLRLELVAGVYPGATWAWGPPDWSGYRQLVFDARIGEPPPLDLIVKIHDRAHNQEHDDRFHRTIRLGSSWQEVRINLAEVAAAPRTRTLDVRQIAVLQFFAIRPNRPRTVYLDNIRLE